MLEGYEKIGQIVCANLMKNTIRRLIEYSGRFISISGITKEYLIGFIDFFNAEGNSVDKKLSDSDRKVTPLSGVYKEAMYTVSWLSSTRPREIASSSRTQARVQAAAFDLVPTGPSTTN